MSGKASGRRAYPAHPSPQTMRTAPNHAHVALACERRASRGTCFPKSRRGRRQHRRRLTPAVTRCSTCAGRVVPPAPAAAPCKQGSGGGASQLPPSSSTGTAGVSKVVCLTNLLSEKALASDAEFSECVQDIRAECEQFGRVEAFVVPRERALAGRQASDVGKCFIAYEDESSAARSAPPPSIAMLARAAGVGRVAGGGGRGAGAAHATDLPPILVLLRLAVCAQPQGRRVFAQPPV